VRVVAWVVEVIVCSAYAATVSLLWNG